MTDGRTCGGGILLDGHDGAPLAEGAAWVDVQPSLGVRSLGDRVHGGVYRLHSRFRRALNFADGDDVVCLVDETVGDGPVNIVMRILPAREGTELIVEEGWIRVGSRRFVVPPGCRWSSRLELRDADAEQVATIAPKAWADLREHAPRESLARVLHSRQAVVQPGRDAPWGTAIATGVRLLLDGREAEGVGSLCGAGIGLTPSGDDFLTGHLAARHLLTRLGLDRFTIPLTQFARHAVHTTLLSRVAMALAAEGCFVVRVKAYVEALARGDIETVRLHAREILRMGFTSGADMLTGLLLTLEAAFA